MLDEQSTPQEGRRCKRPCAEHASSTLANCSLRSLRVRETSMDGALPDTRGLRHDLWASFQARRLLAESRGQCPAAQSFCSPCAVPSGGCDGHGSGGLQGEVAT